MGALGACACGAGDCRWHVRWGRAAPVCGASPAQLPDWQPCAGASLAGTPGGSLTRGELRPVLGEGRELVEGPLQPPAVRGEPVIAGLIEFDQPGFSQFAEALGEDGRADREGRREAREGGRGTTQVPHHGEGVPPPEEPEQIVERGVHRSRLSAART